ncbi:hypothetical protein [Lactobacillus crispatus]
MSFKGFIKTNYLRFIYINILSVISGVAAIGAGYVSVNIFAVGCEPLV